jgi:hypothetical protein
MRRATYSPMMAANSNTFRLRSLSGLRLRKGSLAKRGLGIGLDDPRLLLRLVYEQSQWSAWAAIAAGLAAIFAIADGLAR